MEKHNWDQYNLPPAVIEKLQDYEPKPMDLAARPEYEMSAKSIKRWVNMYPPDAWVYIAGGLGDGSAVRALYEHINKDAVIVAIEGQTEKIYEALEILGSDIISSGRIILINENSKMLIHQQLARIADPLCRQTIVTSFLYDYDVEFWNGVIENILNFLDSHRTNTATILLNSRKTYENVLLNLKDYVKYPAVTEFLHDVYKDKPAVVIGAGPSIDKQLGWLQNRFQENYLLISVPTMLKPLLAIDICPDIVCALDYHELSGRFFEDLPQEKIHANTTLVCQPNVNPAVIRNWKALGLHLYMVRNEWASFFLEPTYETHQIFIGGATVAHLCYLLADFLGCDPVITLGLDLAFTDNQYYARCIYRSFDWKKGAQERLDPNKYPIRLTKDVYGEPIPTDEQMQTYLEELEVMFSLRREADKTIIDCTEGGAKKVNVETMGFYEALKKYCQVPIKKKMLGADSLYDLLGIKPTFTDIENNIKNRLEEIEKVKEINKTVRDIHQKVKAEEWSDEKRRHYGPIIKKARDETAQYPIAVYLIKMWSGKIDMWRARLEKKAEILKLDPEAKIKEEIKKDKLVTVEVDECCDEMIKCLDNILGEK